MTSEQIDDRALVERIVRAYRLAIARDPDSRASEWAAVEDAKKRSVHDVLMSADIGAVATILRDPGRTDLFYGFDNLCAALASAAPEAKSGLATEAEALLVRLAQAVGAYRVPNKYYQVGRPHSSQAGSYAAKTEDTLKVLDEAFGIRIDFPNPFPGELGVETSRGIASYRAIQALYQAWRMSLLCAGRDTPRVVEVGAGLGRTAYYASKLGLRHLTIIDIAMSGVAQAYFLGRVLGADAVRLYGEEEGAGIRILPPSAFLEAGDRYDLLVNIDSWTEMPKETARQYMRAGRARCSMIWSVNHEAGAFTVKDLFDETAARPARLPYWMRDAYVDEFFDSGSLRASSLAPPPRFGAQTIDRARRRFWQVRRGIVRWKPINGLISKLR
jgi:hypothetical protein